MEIGKRVRESNGSTSQRRTTSLLRIQRTRDISKAKSVWRSPRSRANPKTVIPRLLYSRALRASVAAAAVCSEVAVQPQVKTACHLAATATVLCALCVIFAAASRHMRNPLSWTTEDTCMEKERLSPSLPRRKK